MLVAWLFVSVVWSGRRRRPSLNSSAIRAIICSFQADIRTGLPVGPSSVGRRQLPEPPARWRPP